MAMKPPNISWRELQNGKIPPIELYHGVHGRGGMGKVVITDHGDGTHSVGVKHGDIGGAPILPHATRKPTDMAMDAAWRAHGQKLAGSALLDQYIKNVIRPHVKAGTEPYEGAKQDFSSFYSMHDAKKRKASERLMDADKAAPKSFQTGAKGGQFYTLPSGRKVYKSG